MTEVVGAHARYEGAGLFESVSANAWSAQLAVRKDGVFGGSLTGSVGIPLTVKSGTARLDMSGAREASEGEPTQGIERNRIRESFRNGHPVDVGIAYAHPIGDSGHLNLSVVERNNPSGKDETFAGVSVNFKF